MSFNKLSANLNRLMNEEKINSSELARRIEIPASSIKKIRNNDNPNPTLTTLIPIANYFSISISQLVGDMPLPKTPFLQLCKTTVRSIPLISWEELSDWPGKAGETREKTEEAEHALLSVEDSYGENTFAVRLDDMAFPGVFNKGTILIIDPLAIPKQHDYVLDKKSSHDPVSLKQILIEDGEIFLKSLLIDQHIKRKTAETQMMGVVIEHRAYWR